MSRYVATCVKEKSNTQINFTLPLFQNSVVRNRYWTQILHEIKNHKCMHNITLGCIKVYIYFLVIFLLIIHDSFNVSLACLWKFVTWLLLTTNANKFDIFITCAFTVNCLNNAHSYATLPFNWHKLRNLCINNIPIFNISEFLHYATCFDPQKIIGLLCFDEVLSINDTYHAKKSNRMTSIIFH